MQPFTLPVPSVQAMTTPAGPPPDTRRVIWSRSSLSMEPIRAAPVSRRPSAALQVALVVCSFSALRTIWVESTPQNTTPPFSDRPRIRFAIKLYRTELTAFAKEYGAHALHEKLKEIDPVSYETIHENNIKRVIRALEFYHQNHTPISAHNEKEHQKTSPYRFAYFVLTDEREKLYRRIDQRVDLMMEQGLLTEVKTLYDMGCRKDMVSMQGLGYKEILDYLDGSCSLEEAVYVIKRETRHFAKRQLTWFRREKDVIWLDKSEFNDREDQMLQKMTDVLHEKGIIQ